MIDKTKVQNVTKYSYLCELLQPKVCKAVEALLFTSKGYNQDKSILNNRYEKDLEIIKAYMTQIFELETI